MIAESLLIEPRVLQYCSSGYHIYIVNERCAACDLIHSTSGDSNIYVDDLIKEPEYIRRSHRQKLAKEINDLASNNWRPTNLHG